MCLCNVCVCIPVLCNVCMYMCMYVYPCRICICVYFYCVCIFWLYVWWLYMYVCIRFLTMLLITRLQYDHCSFINTTPTLHFPHSVYVNVCMCVCVFMCIHTSDIVSHHHWLCLYICMCVPSYNMRCIGKDLNFGRGKCIWQSYTRVYENR